VRFVGWWKGGRRNEREGGSAREVRRSNPGELIKLK